MEITFETHCISDSECPKISAKEQEEISRRVKKINTALRKKMKKILIFEKEALNHSLRRG